MCLYPDIISAKNHLGIEYFEEKQIVHAVYLCFSLNHRIIVIARLQNIVLSQTSVFSNNMTLNISADSFQTAHDITFS